MLELQKVINHSNLYHSKSWEFTLSSILSTIVHFNSTFIGFSYSLFVCFQVSVFFHIFPYQKDGRYDQIYPWRNSFLTQFQQSFYVVRNISELTQPP